LDVNGIDLVGDPRLLIGPKLRNMGSETILRAARVARKVLRL